MISNTEHDPPRLLPLEKRASPVMGEPPTELPDQAEAREVPAMQYLRRFLVSVAWPRGWVLPNSRPGLEREYIHISESEVLSSSHDNSPRHVL